jgi:hypothetical protein
MIQDEDMKRDRRMKFKPVKMRDAECVEWETWWDLERARFDERPKPPEDAGDAYETGFQGSPTDDSSGSDSGLPF